MSANPEYGLFRFHFLTPVRFGDGRGPSGLDGASMTLASDRFFAAFCTEWLALFGEEELGFLIDAVRSNQFLFSSLFPWKQNNQSDEYHYFLPKPHLSFFAKPDSAQPGLKKRLKDLKYIPAEQLSEYIGFLKGQAFDLQQLDIDFGMVQTIDRVNLRDNTEPLPYRVSSFRFFDHETASCGLYWLYRLENESLLDSIRRTLDSLGLTGMGGKTSSGLGKYKTEWDLLEGSKSGSCLLEFLTDHMAGYQMALGSLCPEGDEDYACIRDPDSRYLLTSRGGFTSSDQFVDQGTGHPIKHMDCMMIQEGSCFKKRMSGTILNLSYGNRHPVYRVGKSLFAGLRL